MLLIYSHITSPRLQYICEFIFKEQLSIDFRITLNSEEFEKFEGHKINYSHNNLQEAFNLLQKETLLFESDIKTQQIECFESNGYKAFFKTDNSDFSFDILAASFYLLSRYEEYLPHQKDMYGRYAHENSLAYKENFLQIPLINIWVKDFTKALKEKFPSLNFHTSRFTFIPTYDIDIAYSYRHKGLLRNLGGFIKMPSAERIKVLLHLKKDPFDSYEFINRLHKKNNLQPVYFFLAATSGSLYDKNISPYTHAMWQLIKKHAKQYGIGLHPSWKSNENISILKKEKKILETASGHLIQNSRQHYIKYELPDTFENLIATGIENDYSMGYGSINGFRASVASPFYFYNLKTEQQTSLRLFPFCYMDANSFYEQKLTAEEAYNELMHYWDQCKKVNGLFITIFHNNFLGTDIQFAGWKEIYSRFISQLPQ